MTDLSYEIFFNVLEAQGLEVVAKRADGQEASHVAVYPITKDTLEAAKAIAISAVKALP